MSEKKPLAGEWWEKEGVRLLIVGTKRSGITVGEHECGSIDLFHHQYDWQHLPDCTGWDWQPEVNTIDVSPGDGFRWLENHEIMRDGDQLFRCEDARFHFVKGGIGAKADSLITNGYPVRRQIENPDPFESPDDWVTQQ